MDFDHLKGNVIKSVLISADKSSISSNKAANNAVEQDLAQSPKQFTPENFLEQPRALVESEHQLAHS